MKNIKKYDFLDYDVGSLIVFLVSEFRTQIRFCLYQLCSCYSHNNTNSNAIYYLNTKLLTTIDIDQFRVAT